MMRNLQLWPITLLICLLATQTSAWAGEKMGYLVNPSVIKKNLCTMEGPSVIEKIEVKRRPNYFFRYLSQKNYALFSSSEHKNYILDLKSKVLYNIPGDVDPVPLWGEDVITTPERRGPFNSPVSILFYRLDLSMQGKWKEAFLLRDEQLKGVYQSVGELTPSTKGTSYTNRVLTDDKGASFRDYQVIKKNGVVVAVKPQGPVVRACPNFNIKTPMISKNGQELAGFDADKGITKIWKLNPKGGPCSEVESLGYPTGKVDFSFDGRYLSFHMNSSLTNYSGTSGWGYQNRPSEADTSNVFVYDRKTKELKQITFNSSNNSYYPVWGRDGRVVYLNHSTSRDDRMSFEVSMPEGASGSKQSFNAGCPSKYLNFCKEMPSFKKYLAQTMVGGMWLKVCTPIDKINPETAKLVAANLPKEKCYQMIEELWWGDNIYQTQELLVDSYDKDAKKRKIHRIIRRENEKVLEELLPQIKAQDLFKACEGEWSKKPVERPQAYQPLGLNVFKKRCVECHGDIPIDDLGKLHQLSAKNTTDLQGKTISWPRAALMRILGQGGEPMPKGAKLKESEIKELQKYLSSMP